MISNEERIERFGLTCTYDGKKYFRGHEYVDLGLPSGTLWAKCNLGAKKETDFGNYYQFGQTEPYEKTFKDYVPLEFDTVSCIWGNGWKTPAFEQFMELVENTNSKWTSVNGVKGYKFISKNDGSKYVFFPACGRAYYGSVSFVGDFGFYWSSSLSTYGRQDAYGLNFYDGNVYWDYYGIRCYGCPVRGVVG